MPSTIIWQSLQVPSKCQCSLPKLHVVCLSFLTWQKCWYVRNFCVSACYTLLMYVYNVYMCAYHSSNTENRIPRDDRGISTLISHRILTYVELPNWAQKNRLKNFHFLRAKNHENVHTWAENSAVCLEHDCSFLAQTNAFSDHRILIFFSVEFAFSKPKILGSLSRATFKCKTGIFWTQNLYFLAQNFNILAQNFHFVSVEFPFSDRTILKGVSKCNRPMSVWLYDQPFWVINQFCD